MEKTPVETDNELDIIWGVDRIADYIKRSNRQTYHLLDRDMLPAKKVGGRWVASKSALREHFAPSTGG